MKIRVDKHGKPLGEVELGPGETTIGRAPHNDIVLGDRAVSGRHASVHLAQGQAVLRDLKSTNGTQVNGRRITTHTLSDGDVIAIANYRITVFTTDRIEEASADPPTRILRLDRPGMPPGLVDEHSTRRIRQIRSTRSGAPGSTRTVRLRVMGGCNQGRHLDLIAPVTALGEPGQEVVVFIRDGDDLYVQLVHEGTGRVQVNGKVLDTERRSLAHNDVITVGEVRMIVVAESSADELGAGTEEWKLD
ncbi:hypothetical protein B1C78_10595 [Thioalkalivibrio denitrificans]|uniref:FHA domain-containing protein n=1 Tax=Thioalkalivibrio denitrificans TaxID=108003 RepID=A0A1V3NFM4_9GAMM|nr:FHA domain-containing protein [Thioalkalivibrio denitrificans]OOG23733.1 hypothetical protein B1C78_10595 [Thioalkalivibrio denitrificans]